MQNTSANSFFQRMEFHIHNDVRKKCGFKRSLFSSTGNVVIGNINDVYAFTFQYNTAVESGAFGLPIHPEQYLKAGQVNAMGLIDEIFHYICRLYRRDIKADFFSAGYATINEELQKHNVPDLDTVLLEFCIAFPPAEVYAGKKTVGQWFAGVDTASGIANKYLALEEFILCKLANENPAFKPFTPLFDDSGLAGNPAYPICWDAIRRWSLQNPPFGVENLDLITLLKAPVEYAPFSLKGQLEYIRMHWLPLLEDMLIRLLNSSDILAEEEKAAWSNNNPGGGLHGKTCVYSFEELTKEYERFSTDGTWMPNVVMIAKSTLVWLDQLSKKYASPITRLDHIPDEELDYLADCGFNALWLIGIWERSKGSARIKQMCGNSEAAASAYSLMDYEISEEIGGWEALANLRMRAGSRGIRLAADMVPNHTGLDAKWVIERPDLFMQTRDCPFPSYTFDGENLSHDSRVEVYLENHYYSKSDCAVVFKRVDRHTGDVRYIYHGNDGTGLPWNDTAQIDFLNPEAREAVIQKITHVARNFPIIRFDAAMVLAKKHIRRLWYPEPGHGGDIASRSRFALSTDEFQQRLPEEFWREVVDRCAKDAPDTLLLAEAFWMMEGYFVRTLGMHRVYNSAFMNMLKKEENAKYRLTIKNTLEFDPQILKRYVNFMNNPDEETAVVQFGRDDKYFGVCTMLVAMPGLPMFGHGQIEGFEEKYGMEYRRAYYQEQVNQGLVDRHRYEIFPLMKKRTLFSDVEHFLLYDFWTSGSVNENVFAWSNMSGEERALILYNNKYEHAAGWIKLSAAYAVKDTDGTKQLIQRPLASGLHISGNENCFVILQEQHSKQWYIRESKQLAEQGLFAALNGFETQVFLNIYEVDDTGYGYYRTLYESLNGKGIADITAGINEIRFKQLYTALAGSLSAAYMKELADCIAALTADADGAAENIASFTTRHTAAITAYIQAVDAAFKQYLAEHPLFNEKQKTKTAAYKPALSDKKELPPSAVKRIKALYTERLTRFIIAASGAGETHETGTNGVNRSQAVSFFTALFAEKKAIGAAAAALHLFIADDILHYYKSSLDAGRLFTYWQLDEKILSLLHAYGYTVQEQRSIVKAVYKIPHIHHVKGRKTARRTGLIKWLSHDPMFAERLDLHDWNHIQWFHRESAEECAADVVFLLFLYSAKPSRKEQHIEKTQKDALKYKRLLDELYAAIHKSEYRTDLFLKVFAGTRQES